MARELVLQFRDDLLFAPNDLFEVVKLDELYRQNSETYLRRLSIKPVEAASLSSLRKLLPVLADISGTLSKAQQPLPTYLFRTEPDLPLQLLDTIAKAQQQRFGGKLPLPPIPKQNPYNVFRFPLPDFISPKQLTTWLGQLRQFLPAKPSPKKAANDTDALLTHICLKDDPTATAYDWPEEATAYADQRFFEAMHIDRLQPNPGNGVGLTIVEAHGWDLGHPQFARRAGRVALLNPALAGVDPARFSLTQPGAYADYAKHGNKVLGVLWASQNEHNPPHQGGDLCRGIVPGATIRLVSCLSSVTLSQRSSSTFKDKEYDEVIALVRAVLHSAPGDVVLVQVGYGGGRYPLNVLPIIGLLTQLAESAGQTVIFAAGNGGLDLSPANAAVRRQEVLNLLPNPANYLSARGARWRLLSVPGLPPLPGILVGGITRPALNNGEEIRPLPTSNQGAAVTVFAPGEGILTTTVRGRYDSISNTSGAAAIIAGMAVALQSKALQQTGLPLPAAEIKTRFGSGQAVAGAPGHVPSLVDASLNL
jgi:hypothetical protein